MFSVQFLVVWKFSVGSEMTVEVHLKLCKNAREITTLSSDTIIRIINICTIQSFLNAAARSIALLNFPTLPAFWSINLHWLALSARVQFRILVLYLASKLGVAPKYLKGHSCSPTYPLYGLAHSLFAPQARTVMAQTTFAFFLGLFLHPSS